MMKITNKTGLPDPIYRAIAHDDYSAGKSDITVSQLSKPPRAVALEKQHWDELEDDASDRIWMLLGTAVHGILEKYAGPNDVNEKRFYCEINGWMVGGKFDTFNLATGILSDYKICSVWAAIKHAKGESDEWECQLNAYSYLIEANGGRVSGLQVVAILRDWSYPESLRNPDYPKAQVLVIPIEKWASPKIVRWLHDRVAAHQIAQKQLPMCTDEERWQKPDCWAVMKEGRKSAVKLHYDESSAKEMLDTLGKGHHIQFRKGHSVRCNYCLVGKNGLCSQWNEEQKESTNDEGKE